MGKVLDPAPPPPAAPARPGAQEAVTVYLPTGEHRLLTRHCETITLPVPAALRRFTLTAVRATARAGVTAAQLIEGAALALGRDFRHSFPDSPAGKAQRTRLAESVVRWLLARCAVLPLPAPTGGTGGTVWTVRLDDGSEVAVRRLDDGRVEAAGITLSAREWLTVAAAVCAAGNQDPITYQEATTT